MDVTTLTRPDRRWVLVIVLLVGLIGGTTPSLAEEVPGHVCLNQVVRIQWQELIPAIPGLHGLIPGQMVQIARVENLTDRRVTLRLRLHYRGSYMVVGSAVRREERERRSVDEAVHGVVMLAPREVAQHYPIDLPNIFRPTPEPETVMGWVSDFHPDILANETSCTVLTASGPQAPAGP